MTPSSARIAEQAAQLRAPITRIALACGALAREASTPRAQALIGRIREATEDLEARVARLLERLAPPASRPADRDLGQALRDLRRRLGPVLEARGVEWRPPASAGSAPTGDPAALQRLVLGMLSLPAPGARGWLRIELTSNDTGYEVGLELSRGLELQDPSLSALEDVATQVGAVWHRSHGEPQRIALSFRSGDQAWSTC